ncbi:MAG: hypothetical protein DWQ01_22755 [Planctomycetota bacterium]|nr:MAG: hypothetical protein DWQ01_22755 [Planctomycetota bacterium]
MFHYGLGGSVPVPKDWQIHFRFAEQQNTPVIVSVPLDTAPVQDGVDYKSEANVPSQSSSLDDLKSSTHTNDWYFDPNGKRIYIKMRAYLDTFSGHSMMWDGTEEIVTIEAQ